MKDIKWLLNRLKAMNLQEMIWRAARKRLQKEEREQYYALNQPVTAIPLPSELAELHIDANRLSINWDNTEWTAFQTLDLFGVFNYEDFKDKWNAGFQTENTWPEEPFSPTIDISQRVDIGDIRTNWELSRHFQFAALAKSYYCTRDARYLSELKKLFSDWNSRNLFLHGVEWTSAMELAIRVNSWVYTHAFLNKAVCGDPLVRELEHGILVMTDRILRHRARFSSANNHLIVEMYAVALVGILADYAPWRDGALKILTDELPRQNYADGVNKEMSLHYQSFVMEAYGLLWLLMIKNHIDIPSMWKDYLTAMTEFVADAADGVGNTIAFGDSDEGKVLDLNGRMDNHYQYVLSLMSCLLDKKYTETPWHENLRWIVPENLRTDKVNYIPALVCSRKEGGYTFLRSKDRRVLIGIDHSDLGFGRIAAHGHADALSFQMLMDGQPVFVDSGTYNYHAAPEDRNSFRSTAAHNTVMIDGQEQSEMLGPFLWGKKAKAALESLTEEAGSVVVRMACRGPAGVHTRRLVFDHVSSLEIHDDVEMKAGRMFLHLAPDAVVRMENKRAVINLRQLEIEIHGGWDELDVKRGKYSPQYGTITDASVICASFHKMANMTIRWRDQYQTLSEEKQKARR